MKRREAPIAAAASLAALMAIPAHAVTTCYDESAFPSVFQLERTGEGLRLLLGPKWWKGSEDRPRTAQSLVYEPSRGWRLGDESPIAWEPKPPECAALIPPIPLSVEEAILLRPHVGEVPRDMLELSQEIGACQQVGDVVWFGIAFYDGEGSEGVGGVGHYNLKTKALEVRRPQELRDASVSHLVYDGDALWIATEGHYECAGFPPVSGLLQYEWESQNVAQQGLCGLVYHDMVLLDGDLWVASDLGLSRGREGEHGLRDWENFIPTPGEPTPLRPITCKALYTGLLDSLSIEGYESPWSMLFRHLLKLHPDFVEMYVREKTRSAGDAANAEQGNAPN